MFSKVQESEYQHGVFAARDLIATKDNYKIVRNYQFSVAAPDQTQWDRGYQHTILDYMRENDVNELDYCQGAPR